MRIGIIGGGAASVSLLHRLIIELSDISQISGCSIEICIIEKTSEIGPGLAYGTPHHFHIINLPAKMMSPIPEEPAHFFHWAQNNKNLWQHHFLEINIETCEYTPRLLYGLYLKHLFNSLIEKAKEKNIVVRGMTGHEAIDILKEQNDQFKIIFANRESTPLVCDKVVLSLGHLDSDNYLHFKGNPSYFHSPWPTQNLEQIPYAKTVFIAGTRLTAIDVCLSLKSQGHRGKIILGSKLGLLPCVIGEINYSFNIKFLTYEKILELTGYGIKKIELPEVMELFKKEVEEEMKTTFDLEKVINGDISAHAFLKKEIDQVKEKKYRGWQNILFSLYSNIPLIWDALSDKSKKEFIEKYYSVWMTYLAAFPIENAEKMLAFLDKREIEVRRKLKDVTYDNEEKTFTVVFDDATIKCDYFINATGAGHDITKSSLPLIQNLLKSGLLVPYPLGGVKVDFKTLQPVSSAHVSGIFIMGDGGTYGACMATADILQFNKQAFRIANTLAYQLKLSLENKTIIHSHKSFSLMSSRNTFYSQPTSASLPSKEGMQEEDATKTTRLTFEPTT